MDRWKGLVALVTGASAGIGRVIAQDLVRNGLRVVALARRADKLKELEEDTKKIGELKGIQCDITSEEDVMKAFNWVEKNWGPIHILVNNAALLGMQPLADFEFSQMKGMFDTNVVGLSLCSREALRCMKRHNINDGHIVNINSYVGHLIFGVEGMAPYCASKNAVTVLSESLRRELGRAKSKTKVTSISPGLTETEMTKGHFPEDAPKLYAQDVSNSVIFAISTPPHVNIVELTVMGVGDVIY